MKKRVVVLGLDGLEPTIVDSLLALERGRALLEEGWQQQDASKIKAAGAEAERAVDVASGGAAVEVRRNDEYYVIAHASRFVHPGAERIESSETDGGLANVAFRNQDDGSIVLIAANSAASPRAVRVRCRDREFRYTMPERSVATFVWTQPGG